MASTEPQYLYSRGISLISLWAKRPLQSLSACTVQLYLYSPYGPYSLYRASAPVQYSYTSTSPMGRMVCTDPQCLYSTAIRLLPLWAVWPVQSLSACTVQLYLYLPYGPYGLYRHSVPVQYSYTSTSPMSRMVCTDTQCLYSTAIPLLPLRAVQPVQSLSACTVQLYLYSPYGPYGLYRASAPVQYSYTSTSPMGRMVCTDTQCLYSTAIPLLPVWAVWSVQTLSACTVQLYLYFPYGPYGLYRHSLPVQYSYTSTPPMDRTACTEPQCLYSTAIPLLHLWAVWSAQTLSACTVQLYIYSPYGPYCLYRASVSVQYSCTSTPPMGRTACTEPKCLYSTAIPLLLLWAVLPVQSLSVCTLQLYLYSPYVPYRLYRASVPVQGRTLIFTLIHIQIFQALPLFQVY